MNRKALAPRVPKTASPFDPAHLAALLDAQWPTLPAVAAALRRCTTHMVRDAHSSLLLDPANTEALMSPKALLTLRCPRLGRINLEVLENDSVLELEFLDQEMPLHPSDNTPEEPVYVPPFTVVHRSWDKPAN